MPRPAVYSRSPHSPPPQEADGPELTAPESRAAPTSAAAPTTASRWSWLQKHFSLHNVYLLWSCVGALALMLALTLLQSGRPGAQKLTQDDINAAVLKTLETTQLP